MNNSSVTFVTGCAISQSNFYITSNLDNLDTWDLFSKTFIYKYQSDDWIDMDLDGWRVVSVAYFENEKLVKFWSDKETEFNAPEIIKNAKKLIIVYLDFLKMN